MFSFHQESKIQNASAVIRAHDKQVFLQILNNSNEDPLPSPGGILLGIRWAPIEAVVDLIFGQKLGSHYSIDRQFFVKLEFKVFFEV